MSHSLKHRQEKIQAKRKTTPRRQFVMEVCSRRNLMFYKTNKGISKYPQAAGREMNLISLEQQKEGISSEIEINSSKSFLDQLSEVYHSSPYPVVNHYGIQENSQRGDEVRGAKNTYLSVSVGDNAEDVIYSFKGETNVSNIINSSNIVQNCQNIYNAKTVRNSYNIFFSKFIYDSSDIRFCDNMLGCRECMYCSGLENQSFCINNKQLSKEQYQKEKKQLLKKKESFDEQFKQLSSKGIVRLSENVTGHTLYNCQHTENAYEVSNIHNGRNALYSDGGNDSSDCYDVIDVAADNTHHVYGVMGQAFGDHIYLSINIVESSYIYYSSMLLNCNYCLGCFNLTGKTYCIFNKQYSKEQRHQKVDQIFSQMEYEGTLGQFFLGSMNPFYFNDTAAYLIDDSFTKEEVQAAGYLRRDQEVKVDIPEWMDVVEVKDLSEYEGLDDDGSRTIDPAILKKVIRDEDGNSYRIIKMEYDFLVKHGLPLPRTHRLQRLKSHFTINA